MVQEHNNDPLDMEHQLLTHAKVPLQQAKGSAKIIVYRLGHLQDIEQNNHDHGRMVTSAPSKEW